MRHKTVPDKNGCAQRFFPPSQGVIALAVILTLALSLAAGAGANGRGERLSIPRADTPAGIFSLNHPKGLTGTIRVHWHDPTLSSNGRGEILRLVSTPAPENTAAGGWALYL